MLNATVSLVWLLLAVFLVHPSDAQSLRWEPHDTEGDVPDGAVRVRLDRGLPLCKGAHAEIEDIKAAWPDVGTAYKGKCRTQRKKKALKVQEEFSILVAKMGDGAGAFNAIVEQTETLSGTLHEWTAAWSEASETIEETYGPHIDPVDEQMIIELIDFQEEELSEDDLPDFDGDGNNPVDAETLDAIYRTAADVEWRLASITGEIVFLHEFLTVSSFADEYAGVNEELAEDLFAATHVSRSPANRLTYLDEVDPFHPHREFPKLTTPQWVGEQGVEAVVTFGIDDMRGPERYETFLRPMLERLKKIDGRAPVSIFTNSFNPDHPQAKIWIK